MAVYEPGSLVKFCLSPPKEIHHCGIFEWGTGLIISLNENRTHYSVLYEGQVIMVDRQWVADIDFFTIGDNLSGKEKSDQNETG